MKPDYGRLMKQMQKMQQGMAKAQEELAQEKVEASAGGGMVKVVISGNQEVKEVKIDAQAVDPNDIEMLEDMVLAAVNEGLRQAQELASKKFGTLAGGLNIPGLT